MSRWMARLALALCLCLLAGAAWSAIPAAAEAGGEAKDITGKCKFKVSEGDVNKIFTGGVGRTWTYSKANAYVGGKLPDGVQAGWLRFEWFYEPTGFELVEYDAGQQVIRSRDETCTFPNIYTVLDLLPETRYFQLKMTAMKQSICNLRVYSAGTLPREVQVWEPPVEKADIMVVSAHQDDELLFMGGTLPYYAVALKKPVVMVYMANCKRVRRGEALNALWKMGVKNYPDFINLKDDRVGRFEEAVKLWGGRDNILKLLVQRIRRYKPEVIVTHDLDGEYGHNQHKLTAYAMKYAIDAAADPEQYPESAALYGAWQVKKLYHHLYKENRIQMDWDTKLDALNGYSPFQVAKIGFKEHKSQLKDFVFRNHGAYDNSKFGLYFTTVGPDVAKNDFLENIDPDASASYVAGHAAEIAAYPVWPDAADAAAVDMTMGEADEETPEAEDIPDEPEVDPSADDALAAEAAFGADASAEADAAQNDEATQAAQAPGSDEPPEPAAMPQPTEAPEPTAAPQTASERGGGAGLATAMVALGVAGLGACGWYAWRTLARRRRRRHRARKRR